MKAKLRLLKSPEEEQLITQRKEQEAKALVNALIVQAVCFKKLKEYGFISKLYKIYKNDNNIDYYLENLESLRYLFKLGTPTDLDIRRIKIALVQIKLLADVDFSSPEKKQQSILLSRLIFRCAIFKRYSELAALSDIATQYRAFESLDYIKKATAPFLFLLEISG
jgi:hypothetical protein